MAAAPVVPWQALLASPACWLRVTDLTDCMASPSTLATLTAAAAAAAAADTAAAALCSPCSGSARLSST
jgi:hypothetical protein